VVGQNAVAEFDPDRLRAARAAAGLSQRELAARARVPSTTIAKWEGGFHRPYAGKLADLAAALGVSPTALTRHGGAGPRTLAQLRVAAGLTQQAAAAHAGLVRTRYSAIERGETAAVAEDVVAAIAAALAVTEAQVRTAHAHARAAHLEQR
jgi:transcriptional regulator with XRE-family HTH domain